MNEIEMQKRCCSQHQAEAQKALDIKLSLSARRSTHLNGVLRAATGAMVGLLAVTRGDVTEDDKFSSDATELLFTTQYMDLLDAVAEDARTRGNERPGTQTRAHAADGPIRGRCARAVAVFAGAISPPHDRTCVATAQCSHATSGNKGGKMNVKSSKNAIPVLGIRRGPIWPFAPPRAPLRRFRAPRRRASPHFPEFPRSRPRRPARTLDGKGTQPSRPALAHCGHTLVPRRDDTTFSHHELERTFAFRAVEDVARLHQFTLAIGRRATLPLDAAAPCSTRSWYLSPESATVQPSSSVVSSGAARQRDEAGAASWA